MNSTLKSLLFWMVLVVIAALIWQFTSLRSGDDEITFTGRFGGQSLDVRVPVPAVLAIYARESGQGMIFTEEDARAGSAASGEPPEPPKPVPPPSGKRPRLKVVK